MNRNYSINSAKYEWLIFQNSSGRITAPETPPNDRNAGKTKLKGKPPAIFSEL
jgi:hypothetical protein